MLSFVALPIHPDGLEYRFSVRFVVLIEVTARSEMTRRFVCIVLKLFRRQSTTARGKELVTAVQERAEKKLEAHPA